MLVETSDNLSTWTQPGDWVYDPAQPRLGLPKKGFFAVFGDLKVRFISPELSDDMLRSLFTPEDKPEFAWQQGWHEILFQNVLGWQIAIVLGFSLIAIAGGLLVCVRIFLGKLATPGEMLWVILGAQQLAYFWVFVTDYTHDLVSTIHHDQKHMALLVHAGCCRYTSLPMGCVETASFPQLYYCYLFVGLLLARRRVPGRNVSASASPGRGVAPVRGSSLCHG